MSDEPSQPPPPILTEDASSLMEEGTVPVADAATSPVASPTMAGGSDFASGFGSSPASPASPAKSLASTPSADEGVSAEVPASLNDFLSSVGVISRPKSPTSLPGSPSSTRGGMAQEDESIMDTSLDLTDERLKLVFELFDADGDGLMDYDTFRRVLEFQTSAGVGVGGVAPSFDDASFLKLCLHLDVDKSGEISYQEFSEGLRLLMLKTLVFPASSSAESKLNDVASIQVIDYNQTRLEQHIVKTIATTTSDTIMSVSDFYFQPRPKWIKSRWINVSGKSSSLTMKRLAVKYTLHPLALQDAISPAGNRPKVEVYANRKCVK
jgi:hypothetical protein